MIKQEEFHIWWNQCLKQKPEGCLSSPASHGRWAKLVWAYLRGLESERRGDLVQRERWPADSGTSQVNVELCPLLQWDSYSQPSFEMPVYGAESITHASNRDWATSHAVTRHPPPSADGKDQVKVPFPQIHETHFCVGRKRIPPCIKKTSLLFYQTWRS